MSVVIQLAVLIEMHCIGMVFPMHNADRHTSRLLLENRGRLHSAHWLASSLKLAVRCLVSGCWPSCFTVSKVTVFYVDKLALVQTFTVSHGQHQLLYLPTGVA